MEHTSPLSRRCVLGRSLLQADDSDLLARNDPDRSESSFILLAVISVSFVEYFLVF